MLDYTLIVRTLALLVVVAIVLYQNAQQKRINCEVQGTCPREEDYGVSQVMDTHQVVGTQRVMWEMMEYFKRLRRDPTTTIFMHEMLDRCRNEDANCAFWALVGECNNSPGFMKVSCAPVCHSCELLSRATRCPADPGHMEQQVWKPGSVNEFFRNLTTLSEYQKYGPELISKPGPNDDMPWLVTLNKFLTDKECDKLLTIANMEGLSPSQDSMGKTPDYAQTWLVNDIIKGDRIVEKILRKIEKLTKIPEVNAENIQVVKVEQGHPQSLHHDYIHQQADRLPGVRILTIFLFLNDIEDGGEMDFPRLGIQVLPKKGRAIVWPTVRDDDPNKREERVFHRAAEVRKGVRYTANVLHHQRDFKGPQLANCH